MKKCLVIGGNGFLGSHLVDLLARTGHEVSAFDRFSSGIATYTSPGVKPIVGDFLDRSSLSDAVEGQDYVFHFLSVTTPSTAEADPTLDIRTNLAQSVDLLEACSKQGVAKIFFASTGGAIYGPQAKEAFTEDDPTLPISPYGIVKLAIENYLRYFKVTRAMDFTVFRISNPYGTRQHLNKVQGLIPVALNRIAAGLPVERFGDGSMIRDYVYVEDLMEMIGRIVTAKSPRELYNLGHGEGHSVNEILASVRRVTGQSFDTVEKSVPRTFVHRSVLDVSRFVDEFGPVRYTPLDVGIQATWNGIVESGNHVHALP